MVTVAGAHTPPPSSPVSLPATSTSIRVAGRVRARPPPSPFAVLSTTEPPVIVVSGLAPRIPPPSRVAVLPSKTESVIVTALVVAANNPPPRVAELATRATSVRVRVPLPPNRMPPPSVPLPPVKVTPLMTRSTPAVTAVSTGPVPVPSTIDSPDPAPSSVRSLVMVRFSTKVPSGTATVPPAGAALMASWMTPARAGTANGATTSAVADSTRARSSRRGSVHRRWPVRITCPPVVPVVAPRRTNRAPVGGPANGAPSETTRWRGLPSLQLTRRSVAAGRRPAG